MGTIYKRPSRVRRATPRWGIEISLPSHLEKQAVLKPGDVVDVFYDDFVLIVPHGVKVDEKFLRRAILQEVHP